MRELYIDRQKAPVAAGASLFECAETIGLHVPTSCVKQGKCRECILEIESGEELLSPRTSEEEHLGEGFRLACRSTIAGEGTVQCHTMRRGAMRIVENVTGLPDLPVVLDPVVSSGYGIAMDVGTTTIALRLYDLATGKPVATQSFENPQRFGGSDIMARIHYDTNQRAVSCNARFSDTSPTPSNAFPCRQKIFTR